MRKTIFKIAFYTLISLSIFGCFSEKKDEKVTTPIVTEPIVEEYVVDIKAFSYTYSPSGLIGIQEKISPKNIKLNVLIKFFFI